MTHRILSTLARRIATLLVAGLSCAGAAAQAIDPQAAAQLLAASIDKPDRGMRATATGRHVEIDQTVQPPADLTPEALRARVETAARLTLDKGCASPSLQTMLAAGVLLTWRFRNQKGSLLTTVELDQAVCGANKAAAAASGPDARP